MSLRAENKLLTASDVAKLCEVDLKTIHNWVERGAIQHFRTPGRHLRFQATDVAQFLQQFGYAIPRRFYAEIAQVVMVIGDDKTVDLTKRATAKAATVRVVDGIIDAMIWIGAEPTAGVVLDGALLDNNPEAVEHFIKAVTKTYPIPIVVLGDDPSNMADRVDVTFSLKGDSVMLRAALAGEDVDPLGGPPPSAPSPARSKKRAKRR